MWIELRRSPPNQVTVHHWSQQLADLRPFFKEHLLTSSDVLVTLLDRKKETATNKTGDDFLYGQPIAKDFPIERFVSKWEHRIQHQSDDHLAAPMTNSGLVWDGLRLDKSLGPHSRAHGSIRNQHHA